MPFSGLRATVGALMLAAFVLVPTLAPVGSGQIPEGVRYKKAPEEVNRKAKEILEHALGASPDAVNFEAIAGEAVACGPLLWDAIKVQAGKELQEAKPTLFVIGAARPVNKEGRAIVTPAQKRAFWKLFIEQVRGNNKYAVRQAGPSEIRYYWATIPFDIEEPLLVADFGGRQVLFNFTVKNGEPKVFWVDVVGDLTSLGSAARPPDAPGSQPAAEPPPRAVEDANAPEGWKRYQFAYGGGDVLTALLPTQPQTYAGKGQVAAGDVTITMQTRTFSANTRTAGYNVFYADSLSLPAEKMTASQKKVFYQELWRSFTRGAVRAFEQAGQKVEVEALGQKPTSVGGREGMEQDFTVGPLRGRARMLLSGQHAYALMALWAQETAEGQTATFFNSLDLRQP